MSLHTFFTSIYIRMVGGLLLSAFTAYLVTNTSLVFILQTPALVFGLIGVQLLLVLGIQWLINKLSATTASFLYVLYAALNGVTMSGFLLYYLTNALELTIMIFCASASLFAFLAFLGYTTKRDMSGWGTFLYAAMWGVLISSLLNMYFQNNMFDFLLSTVSLVIFSAMTVYDTQYFKHLHGSVHDHETQQKAVTIGALHMYINFIVIFQDMLRIVSRFRD